MKGRFNGSPIVRNDFHARLHDGRPRRLPLRADSRRRRRGRANPDDRARFAADLNVPYLQTILLSAQQEQQAKTESYLRENLNAMAVLLGQMQVLQVGQALHMAAEVAKNISGSEFKIIPGAGHTLNLEAVPQMSKEIKDFISK